MIFKLYEAKWSYGDQAEVVRLAKLGFKFQFDREAFNHSKAPARVWYLTGDRQASIEVKSLDDLMALVHDWPNEGIVVNNDTITIYNGYLE